MKDIRINYIDLARFIGIYAVVLGHFTPFEGVDNEIGRELLYMFHVPLFFVVSGMLSKPASVLKTFCSLMIPYLIYNVISIFKMDFVALLTFDALTLNNSPTWFFVALFFIKITADFINKGLLYYIGFIITAITLLHCYNLEIPRLFGLHAYVYGLLFFLFGKYLKDKIQILLSAGNIILCVGIPFLLYVFVRYERFDLYSSEIHNPIIYFLSSCMATLIVLIVCNKVIAHISSFWHNFIFVNSRGTMLILGTHYILLGIISKYIIPGIHLSFLLKTILVCLLSFPYYYVIKYTYNRLTFLYGKFNCNKK